MAGVRSLQSGLGFFLLLLVVLPAWRSAAAADAPALTVGDSGAYLFASQDDKAERISKLESGEELKPLASSVGAVTWYLVKTRKGVIGWVRSSDLSASHSGKTVFAEDILPRRSTWFAVTPRGRIFGGTWSVEASLSTSASGTWTLRDATDKTVLHGTWSAEKFSTGWNGVWRAVVDGQNTEYSGTWTAALGLADHDRLADLLEAAVSGAVRGVWATENYSGVWSITAAK
jgi:Bacterial SH3 domain